MLDSLLFSMRDGMLSTLLLLNYTSYMCAILVANVRNPNELTPEINSTIVCHTLCNVYIKNGWPEAIKVIQNHLPC
jgi:hypothetical protein